ncbi:MAG: hypothetical protein EOP45_06900 [Sphingobacteriaceae bacterium]|nr:MAG: hypothetical protein EOP45_06900 [Sphingobacteriaceae bacterium]
MFGSILGVFRRLFKKSLNEKVPTGRVIWGTVNHKIERVIHSDDLDRILQEDTIYQHRFLDALFLCENYIDNTTYITIKDYFSEFRIRKDAFKPIYKAPFFEFGEQVRLKKKPEKLRKIMKIANHEHSNVDCVVYHINVENGDYVRLDNVAIGYKLPATLVNKLRVSRIRLYASAQNIFVITKYKGLDPETSTINTVNTAAYGVDYNGNPQQRTFTFGVNVGF